MIEKIFPDTTFDKTLGKNLPILLREKTKKNRIMKLKVLGLEIIQVLFSVLFEH